MRRQLSTVRLEPTRPVAVPSVRRDATEPQHAKTTAGVLRLQRTYGNAATSALLAGGAGGVLAVQRQPKPPGPLEKAGQALRGFEDWADDEKKRQNVIDKAAVVGLDPKQASSVQAAAVAIAGHVATMRAAAGRVDPSLATLRIAVVHADKARRLMLSGDPADHRSAGSERKKSKDAVQQAIGQVSKVTGVDTAGLVKNLDAIGTHLDNDGSPADVVKYLNRVIDALGKVRTSAETRAAAGQAIDVLLRAFLAVNNPAFKAAPTAAEIATVRSQLSGGLQDEFVAVFDNAVDFEFFTEFANTWGQQIDARTKMTEAGVAAPAVPGRTDAQTYFGAVHGKDNAAVFAAYESFASAFFVHRGIAGVGDLTRTVDDLFTANASITGRRGMVCTGFATMGAEALGRAGATLTGFKVGIHASDDMVRNDKLEEAGHAVAQMSRNGKPFCVSNEHILPVKDALEGKDAILWGDQSNRLFVGSGKTMGAAVAQLLGRVAARKRALP